MVGVKRSGLDVSDELLGGEIPDLNSVLGSEDEPVFLGGEENAVDRAINFGLAEELALNEVPDDSDAVLTAGSQVRGLGGHVERVDLSLVADEGVLQGHCLVIPHLDGLIP